MSETNCKEVSRKEKNINKVVHVALASFVKYGIDGSKVSEIGRIARLTERSVFRYFDTKSDLVLAAAMLFWDKVKTLVLKNMDEIENSNKTGLEEIEIILRKYTDIYFTHYKQFIFVHEAESYLYRSGKDLLIKNHVLSPFATSEDPVALAIKKGIKDGSVNSDINIENAYFNTYDSLLGLMEKFAITRTEDKDEEKVIMSRLNDFCHTLTLSFKK